MRAHIVLLAAAEAAVLMASFYFASYLRVGGEMEMAEVIIGHLLSRAAVFTSLMLLALLSVGLYRSRRTAWLLDTLVRIVTAVALASIADATVSYLIPAISTGRGVLAIALGAAFIGLLATRTLFYALFERDRFKRNILVLGHGKTAASLASLYGSLGQRSLRVVGYLGVGGEEASAECVPLLPREKPILGLAVELEIDEVVVAMDNRRERFPTRELLDCRIAGIRVTDAVTFVERESGRINLQALNPSWLIFGGGFRQGGVHKAWKRTFDIIASLLLLPIAIPLVVLAGVAIFIESGGEGEVLLRQGRVGRNGKVFEMLKLRSMVSDAEHDGQARWSSVDDPRVTRVGALIRRLRIDELPQIFNILVGHMSFVGPRPERPEFVRDLNEQILFYAERHCVKPGLTGWAQLCYPYGASLEDARQKLQYDLFYVKNYSPMFDLLVLLETLEVVIWGKSRPVVSQSSGPTAVGAAQQRKIA
jgi:sugar transferase (PEP-CTERM system associated)